MNKPKRVGTSWESALVEFFRERGHNVLRPAQKGNKDIGDIVGVPNWTFEAKNTARLDFAGAIDEAKREAENAGTIWYAALVKRRGKGVSQGYAVMPMHLFLDILDTFGGGPIPYDK